MDVLSFWHWCNQVSIQTPDNIISKNLTEYFLQYFGKKSATEKEKETGNNTSHGLACEQPPYWPKHMTFYIKSKSMANQKVEPDKFLVTATQIPKCVEYLVPSIFK